MSWQAMASVDDLPFDLCKPLAYRVLVKLANVADQDGRRAFRSKKEMANELGVSERSIQRALAELQVLHLIRIGDQKFVSHLRGDRRPTVYDIVMQRAGDGVPVIDDGFDGETHGETEISTPVKDTPHGETHGETPGVAQGTNRTNYSSNKISPSTRVCAEGHALIIEGRWCKYAHLAAELVSA